MVEPFRSFDELKTAHDSLRRQYAEKSREDYRSSVASFLDAAEQAGAHIEREDERRAATELLEYWSIEFVTLGPVDSTYTVRKLAPFGGATEAPGRSHADEMRDIHARRDASRLAALARQWTESGKDTGYLLAGDALDSARAHAGSDPVIAELVRASDAAELQRGRRQRRYYSYAIVALIGAVIAIGTLAVWAMSERAIAERETLLAEQQTQLAIEQRARAELEQQRASEQARIALEAKATADIEAEQARLERDQQRDANRLASERAGKLDALQDQLDRIRRELNDAVAEGAVTTEALPPSLVALLNPAQEPPNFVFPPDHSPLLNGYQPDFLGVAIPAPVLAPGAAADATTLPYYNYSLVFDRGAQLARLSMSNLDRSLLEILPRTGTPIAADPRLLPSIQPDLARFAAAGLEPGRLVSLREISWGTIPDAIARRAAAFFEGMTNVRTNLTPQTIDFSRRVWSSLDEYALQSFNADASRITIFSGPVLGPDAAATADGLPIPRDFFKVLVSTRADRKEPELVVEAYLLRREDGAATEFTGDLEPLRVRLATIEAVTGIDFGDALRDADRQFDYIQQNVFSPADEQALLAQDVAGSDTVLGGTAARQLGALLASGTAPAPVEAQVVDALLAAAADAATPEAIERTLSVLLDVYPLAWSRPDWIDRRAVARRRVADWARPADPDMPRIGGATLDRAASLSRILGLPVAHDKPVYLQFAGFPRPEVEALSRRLEALGWNMPGEERVANNRNEVRYATEAERPIAEELAADIRAAGFPTVQARRTEAVNPGVMEIWISG